jgi:hypothetical protein
MVDGAVVSMTGPISCAMCKECLDAGVEPWDMVVGTVWVCGGYDSINDHYKEIVAATMAKFGKTMDDLNAEVEKADLDEHYFFTGMQMCDENDLPICDQGCSSCGDRDACEFAECKHLGCYWRGSLYNCPGISECRI